MLKRIPTHFSQVLAVEQRAMSLGDIAFYCEQMLSTLFLWNRLRPSICDAHVSVWSVCEMQDLVWRSLEPKIEICLAQLDSEVLCFVEILRPLFMLWLSIVNSLLFLLRIITINIEMLCFLFDSEDHLLLVRRSALSNLVLDTLFLLWLHCVGSSCNRLWAWLESRLGCSTEPRVVRVIVGT